MYLILLSCLLNCADSIYYVGVGRADCTGPPTEVNLMGFAEITQIACGLHLRQFVRAFVVNDGTTSMIFVNIDAHSTSDGVRQEVLVRLNRLYNGTYNEQNVIISSTHTHSTPGGHHKYFLYDISVKGFSQQYFDYLVDAITKAITKAHNAITESRIFLNVGVVPNANINRSPAAYLMNPEAERSRYRYNVDKEITQLKFVRVSDDKPIGTINWFAVHPNTMNSTNCLVSSDNLGYASVLLESHFNGDVLTKEGFVGAFASTNIGDVSPNTKGPICVDTGNKCDFVTSTCDGDAATCIASGPGKNMFESTRIIAERIYNKSLALLQNGGTELSGPVRSIHQYIDMTKAKVEVLSNGTKKLVRGCSPAMGYNFAAGTTDGPGISSAAQGTGSKNFLLTIGRDLLSVPTKDDVKCHHPKKILINSGKATFPYEWQPKVVPTQVATIGFFVVVAVPGEFTTMSGRRMREAVRQVVGKSDTKVVVSGLANVYTSYVATPDEYQLQRYEAASTIYGPYTLDIYINQYKKLVSKMMNNETVDSGPRPAKFPPVLVSLVEPPSFDGSGLRKFGECLKQPRSKVSKGDTVVTKFVSGNPRHNPLHGDTFFVVEVKVGDGWTVVATDANWETRLYWERTNVVTRQSESTIEWMVGEKVQEGEYRIRWKGHYKTVLAQIEYYEGGTRSFIVQ